MEEERQEMTDGEEISETIEKVKTNREFLRGTLFGFLLTAIVVMAIVLVRFGTFGIGRKETGSAVLVSQATQQKLEEVERIISGEYLHEVDGGELEKYLFRGVAAGLDDVYADYYTKEELEEVNTRNDGTYFGIGVVFEQSRENDQIRVQSVYPGSPAEQAGIETGDVLIAADGTDVTQMELNEAVSMIKENRGEVVLTFLRGEKKLDIPVSFDEVEISQITWQMQDDGIGYIRISEFDMVTVRQFREAVEAAEGEGAKALIIDVRQNPGGLLLSVCSILDDLLDECLLVSTRSRTETGEELYAEDGHIFEGPIAVLVDAGSASASEVFAGVLQDYEKAVIIGTKTYGKGVVQRTFGLSDGSALKLTTEKYFTGGGQDLDGTGITPDFEVEEEEEQLEKAISVLQDALTQSQEQIQEQMTE